MNDMTSDWELAIDRSTESIEKAKAPLKNGAQCYLQTTENIYLTATCL